MVRADLDGIPRIIRRRQGAHPSHHEASVQGIVHGEQFPETGGALEVFFRFRFPRQYLQGLLVCFAEPPGFFLPPLLEFVGGSKVELIQERTPVGTHGFLQSSLLEAPSEELNVGADDLRIQVQSLPFAPNAPLTQSFPKAIDGVRQGMASRFRGAFGPENSLKLVSASPGLSRRCQEGQESELSWLTSLPGDGTGGP
jgi:hypothetical protein